MSAAKDELPQEWFVRAELLARCPQLLCVSSTGAGYDTVDLPACTAAGVLVVNQAGGNAPSVAEHTLGLMLGVSRRMLENDRRMRREHGFTREDVTGMSAAPGDMLPRRFSVLQASCSRCKTTKRATRPRPIA